MYRKKYVEQKEKKKIERKKNMYRKNICIKYVKKKN